MMVVQLFTFLDNLISRLDTELYIALRRILIIRISSKNECQSLKGDKDTPLLDNSYTPHHITLSIYWTSRCIKLKIKWRTLTTHFVKKIFTSKQNLFHWLNWKYRFLEQWGALYLLFANFFNIKYMWSFCD